MGRVSSVTAMHLSAALWRVSCRVQARPFHGINDGPSVAALLVAGWVAQRCVVPSLDTASGPFDNATAAHDAAKPTNSSKHARLNSITPRPRLSFPLSLFLKSIGFHSRADHGPAIRISERRPASLCRSCPPVGAESHHSYNSQGCALRIPYLPSFLLPLCIHLSQYPSHL